MRILWRLPSIEDLGRFRFFHLSRLRPPGHSIESSHTLADHEVSYPSVDRDLNEFDIHVAWLKEVFARTPANPSDKEWLQSCEQFLPLPVQYMRNYCRCLSLYPKTSANKAIKWGTVREEGITAISQRFQI
jgi:hypothetical protein